MLGNNMAEPLHLRVTENVRRMNPDEIYQQLESVLPTGNRSGQWARTMWSNRRQQYLFARAIELYRRGRNFQRSRAANILRHLHNSYWLNWTIEPRPYRLYARSNSNNNSNTRSNSNSNSYNNSNTRSNSNSGENYSKVRKYAERWRLKGPVKLVNLPENPNNRTDPISLHEFKRGHEAIRHQRRNASGRVISTRYYLLPTLERLSGMKWNAIRRMHPNKILKKETGTGNKFLATVHLPNAVTRLPMYRRDLNLVKFK